MNPLCQKIHFHTLQLQTFKIRFIYWRLYTAVRTTVFDITQLQLMIVVLSLTFFKSFLLFISFFFSFLSDFLPQSFISFILAFLCFFPPSTFCLYSHAHIVLSASCLIHHLNKRQGLSATNECQTPLPASCCWNYSSH